MVVIRHNKIKTEYSHSNNAHDDRWYRKDNGLEDQDEFNPPQHRAMIHYQVQPRVQKPALRDDHDQPCQVNHSDGALEVGPYPKIGEDNEERL